MKTRAMVRTVLGATLLLAACMALTAQAQQAAYPSRAVRMIIPAAPGGNPDLLARMLSQKLADAFGKPFIVENVPGAGGVVAAEMLARAAPDGHTIMLGDSGALAINIALNSKLGYQPLRDFAAVTALIMVPTVLVVHPTVPANTLQEFIALAKSKPGTLNYGSSGIGSTHHLTMEAMKAALGLDIVHVPFKGTGQSVPALIGGQVDVLFSALPSLAGFVKGGQVKLLATNAARRTPQEPNLPALAELIPGFDFAPIVGVLAATGTPANAIERISAEIAVIAKTPEVVTLLGNAGIDAIGSGPADYNRAILGENERLTKAVQLANIKSE